MGPSRVCHWSKGPPVLRSFAMTIEIFFLLPNCQRVDYDYWSGWCRNFLRSATLLSLCGTVRTSSTGGCPDFGSVKSAALESMQIHWSKFFSLRR